MARDVRQSPLVVVVNIGGVLDASNLVTNSVWMFHMLTGNFRRVMNQ